MPFGKSGLGSGKLRNEGCAGNHHYGRDRRGDENFNECETELFFHPSHTFSSLMRSDRAVTKAAPHSRTFVVLPDLDLARRMDRQRARF